MIGQVISNSALKRDLEAHSGSRFLSKPGDTILTTFTELKSGSSLAVFRVGELAILDRNSHHKKTSLANRQAGEKANILSLLVQAAPKNCLPIMMRAR